VTGATPPVLIQNTYRKNQAEKTLLGPKTSDSHDVPVPCGGHSSPDLVADLAKERQRRQLCASLGELFDKGVGVYRERLRKKVEQDASKLFLQLTTEPDYASLKINENYGLIIVHKDGDEIQVRSAGAEHVVALSLMGALQRNAPLEGPIVMDSPFGRLDEGHTGRIVKALPSMAKQVLLLVYESELEPQFVRNTLKGDLLREYKIVRKSARHSVLEQSKG